MGRENILRVRVRKEAGEVKVDVWPPGADEPVKCYVENDVTVELLQSCLHVSNHPRVANWYRHFGTQIGKLFGSNYLGRALPAVVQNQGHARIIIEAADSAYTVPWELSHGFVDALAAKFEPLGEHHRISFTRVPSLVAGERRTPSDTPARVRVLLVSGQDDALPDLGPAENVLNQIKAPKRPNESTGGTEDVFEVEHWDSARFLRCIDDLADGMKADSEKTADLRRQFEIIHLFAHGGEDEESSGVKLPYVRMQRASEDSTKVKAKQLLDYVAGRCHVLILQSCKTRGLAPLALDAGVPAVVAMLHEIKAAASTAFVGTVYERLANGEALDVAVQRGRFVVGGDSHLGAPVLYARDVDPITLRVGAKGHVPPAGAQADSRFAVDDSGETQPVTVPVENQLAPRRDPAAVTVKGTSPLGARAGKFGGT